MGRLWKVGWEPQNRGAILAIDQQRHHRSRKTRLHPYKAMPLHMGPPLGMGGNTARQVASDSWRQHAFWSCPIAMAIRREITSCLSPETELSRANVWLLRPPPLIHGGVWVIVEAAALSAMDMGRRAMSHALH